MNTLVTTSLTSALLVLLLLLLLPFWLATPKLSKDERLVQGILHPGHRRFSLILPEGWNRRKKLPLVIALHFGGHGMPFYGERFLKELIEPSLRDLGAVFAAPDCPTTDWAQPESEVFVLDLMKHIQEKYPIDHRRVLLAGYSMGGIGTWHLVGRYPELFSAGLVMAANPVVGSGELDGNIPLYVIHGRDDELFPIINTTRVVVQLEEMGVDITYRILEKTTHFETYKFNDPLKNAVPWILDRWGSADT